MQSTNELKVNIGTQCDGTSVSRDIKRLPHLLIAGGEKGEARAYLTSLLLEVAKTNAPSVLRVLAMQLDAELNALPHLLAPVTENESEAEAALLWLKNEAQRRFGLFTASGVHNIDTYNEKAPDKLYHVIAAIGDISKLTKRSVEYAAMLAAKARATGIYLLAAEENASARTIPSLLKANIPSRIALKTETKAQSRVILDTAGAEKLSVGDILFLPIGTAEPQRLSRNAAEISVSEIAELHSPAERITIAYEKPCETPLLRLALETAIEHGGVSAALLQRKLHIGYKKAAGLIEEMEAAGYVGEYCGSKPRRLLLTKTELEKLIKEI